MKATINKLNLNVNCANAFTENDILVVFHGDTVRSLRIGHDVEVDLEKLDAEQVVKNLTTGYSFSIVIKSNDVHDLRILVKHGSSKFASFERRKGA
jgi:hypothetical protein